MRLLDAIRLNVEARRVFVVVPLNEIETCVRIVFGDVAHDCHSRTSGLIVDVGDVEKCGHGFASAQPDQRRNTSATIAAKLG